MSLERHLLKFIDEASSSRPIVDVIYADTVLFSVLQDYVSFGRFHTPPYVPSCSEKDTIVRHEKLFVTFIEKYYFHFKVSPLQRRRGEIESIEKDCFPMWIFSRSLKPERDFQSHKLSFYYYRGKRVKWQRQYFIFMMLSECLASSSRFQGDAFYEKKIIPKTNRGP